jgi:hypothetical protein
MSRIIAHRFVVIMMPWETRAFNIYVTISLMLQPLTPQQLEEIRDRKPQKRLKSELILMFSLKREWPQ